MTYYVRTRPELKVRLWRDGSDRIVTLGWRWLSHSVFNVYLRFLLLKMLHTRARENLADNYVKSASMEGFWVIFSGFRGEITKTLHTCKSKRNTAFASAACLTQVLCPNDLMRFRGPKVSGHIQVRIHPCHQTMRNQLCTFRFHLDTNYDENKYSLLRGKRG